MGLYVYSSPPLFMPKHHDFDTVSVFNDRYMRNDLTRLQIRCVNAAQGCDMVCSLENLHTHEDECEFTLISCSNTGMKPHAEHI